MKHHHERSAARCSPRRCCAELPRLRPERGAGDELRFGANRADAARRHLSRRSRRRRDQFARRHLRLHAHRPSDGVDGHRASVRARRLAAVPVRSQREIHARDRPGRLRLPVRRAGPRRSAGQHLGRRRDVGDGDEVRSAGPRRVAPRAQGGSDSESAARGRAGGGGEGGGGGGGGRPERARSRTSSTVRPTSRGTRRAISSSPTAAATRASPSSRRTACS